MSKRELEQAIRERDQAKADIEAWRSRCNDLTDTAEKAAQIYMMIAPLPLVNTITDAQMHLLEEHFGVKAREGWLE